MLVKNTGAAPITINLRDGSSYPIASGATVTIPDAKLSMLDDSAAVIALFNAGTLSVTTDAGAAFVGFPTVVNSTDAADGKVVNVLAKVGPGGLKNLVTSAGAFDSSGMAMKATARAANKAAANNAATTQARGWSAGMTVQPFEPIRLGDGAGATATASLTTNAVSSVAVTNGGSGYTKVPAVTFSGGGGTGAAATAVLTNGVVTAINVTNGGSGYSTAPTVSIAGSNGAIVIALQAAAASTGTAEPVIAPGSSPAAITDNAATWWPTQEQTRTPPAGVPIPTYTDNAGASSRTLYNLFGRPELFESLSAPNLYQVAGSGNTIRNTAWTVNDGSATDYGAGAGRLTQYRTNAFIVDDDLIDIGYFATVDTFANQRIFIDVAGYPTTEVPIIPAAFGGSRYIRLTIPGGRRERMIRIRSSGVINLSYIAVAADATIRKPATRGLTIVAATDSFGNTEMPSINDFSQDLAPRLTRRLGYAHCVMATVGGTSYSFDDAASGRQSLQKIIAAHDFSAFGADAFLLMHGYNAGGNGVAPDTETAAAIWCWQRLRAAAPSAAIVVFNVHYLRPGFVSQMTAMRDAIKAKFLAWADPLSVLVDPTDGSVTLGDGTVVKAANTAYFTTANASLAIPAAGGVFDGAHPSIAGRALYEDRAFADADLGLTALGL